MDLNRYVLGYQRNTTMKIYLECLAARYIRSAVRALGPMRSRAARSRPRSMILFPPPHGNVLVAADPALCDSNAIAIYIHNRPIKTLVAPNPSHVAMSTSFSVVAAGYQASFLRRSRFER